MQALKALVIFMAVLIVAGMVLLVYGLMTRGGTDRAVEGGLAPAGTAFGTVDLAVPDGCTIAGTEMAGDRLILRLDGLAGRGCRQVVVVDLASGRELGRVRALPDAAPSGQ